MEHLATLALVALSLHAQPQTGLPIAGPDAARLAEPAAPVDLEVPFACGAKVVISQAHGTFSHVGTDRWAWDFRVPEGTPILAAHDGVVRLVRSDSVRGGCDRSFGPDANYVILSNGKGLETQYLHFSKVFVAQGEQVVKGQALGEVGRTGFSCGSHLHFQLQRESPAWAGQSVPARFRGIGDPAVDAEVVSGNCPGGARTIEAKVEQAAQPSPR
ncbi:MAG TPA: M23 family metallopeptidase [Myxococcales bacterium]|jgi:murein DD-endopeptidase MepM/ murein hydrolase activator NlpD